MKIIVDEMPKNPIDCLFSVRSGHNGVIYYICSLKENIEGKHKNSPCICKCTDNCACLKKLFNDKGEVVGL